MEDVDGIFKETAVQKLFCVCVGAGLRGWGGGCVRRRREEVGLVWLFTEEFRIYWLGLEVCYGKGFKYLTQAAKNKDLGCERICSACILFISGRLVSY